MTEIIALTQIITPQICASQCLSCLLPNNPYACQTCPPFTYFYIFSCQNSTHDLAPFIVVTVIITLLHIIMILLGLGAYRQIFQNIQLVTLVTWRYGFQGGVIALQGTNLNIIVGNHFPSNFGDQFIVVMVFIALDWIFLFIIKWKKINTRLTDLIERKAFTFPTRIITFIFNIVTYTSLLQVVPSDTQSSFGSFAFVLAILALIKVFFVLVSLAVTTNWKYFDVQDPLYYTVVEQIKNKNCITRNALLVSLLIRTAIITIFVCYFQQPYISGLVMVILQAVYTIFIVIFIRYTHIRFALANIAGNVLTTAVLVTVYLGGVSQLNSQEWTQAGIAYEVLVMAMAVLYFGMALGELIKRCLEGSVQAHLKHVYHYYFKCEEPKQKQISQTSVASIDLEVSFISRSQTETIDVISDKSLPQVVRIDGIQHV